MKSEFPQDLIDFKDLPESLSKSLIGILASRVHLYNFLRDVKDFYLPRVEVCSMQFLLKLFADEVKAVSSKAVQALGFKPVLKVKRAELIRMFESSAYLRPYLTDCTYMEKDFLVSQLAVLDPHLFHNLSLKSSLRSRDKPLSQLKQLYIQVCPEFAESLLRMPPKPNQPVTLRLMVQTPKKQQTSQPESQPLQGMPNKRVKVLDDAS